MTPQLLDLGGPFSQFAVRRGEGAGNDQRTPSGFKDTQTKPRALREATRGLAASMEAMVGDDPLVDMDPIMLSCRGMVEILSHPFNLRRLTRCNSRGFDPFPN